MPTVSKQLNLLCWNNGLPFDVKCLIERYLQRGILQQVMLEITDSKMHRNIKRCINHLKRSNPAGYPVTHPSVKRETINYGRFMLHIIHPNVFQKKFVPIDVQYLRMLKIGGVGFRSGPRQFHNLHWLGVQGLKLDFGYTTQKQLIEAINNNTNARKIKGLKSMSKPELFSTLLKLPEFSLE
jgi:hypothetical protein